MRLCQFAGRSALAAGFWLLSLPALAGEWHQSIALPVALEHDSNPTMAAGGKSVWLGKATPAYNMIGTFGRDEVKASLALQFVRSSDESVSMNRDDPSVSLGWRRQTAVGEFGLSGKYLEASTRFSELADSGLIVRDGTRRSRSVAGNWRTALTERQTLAVDATYQSVSYDGGTLVNYNNLATGLTMGYAWSERIEPFMRLSFTRYDPVAGASSNQYSVQGGVKVKVSEYLEWTAQAGTNRITGQTQDTGWLGSMVLRYTGTRSDMALDLGRYITPSGTGGFIESNQVRGAWSYALGERTRTGLEASWRDSKGNPPNTMQQFGVWLGYDLSQFWNLRLSYQRKQRQQSGQPSTSANILGMTLVYSHPEF